MTDAWRALLDPVARPRLARLLLDYVRLRRWFRAKSRTPRAAEIADLIPLDGAQPPGDVANWLVLLAIDYDAGPRDVYTVPLATASPVEADILRKKAPHAIIAALGQDGFLADGLATGKAARGLLEILAGGRTPRGERGTLRGEGSAALTDALPGAHLAVKVPDVEQTNSTLMFGELLLLKIYRQIAAGPSPELEVGRFLSSHCHPPCAPRVLGALSYDGDDGETRVVGVAHEYLPNDGDAWSLTLRELRAYLGRASEQIAAGFTSPPTAKAAFAPLLGRFQMLSETLGRRTAQLHLALASAGNTTGGALFAPEPMSPADRDAMVTRAMTMLEENVSVLERAIHSLSPGARAIAESLRAGTGVRLRLTAVLDSARVSSVSVVKTRTHGDLHLGQVLSRGDDFVIIDFEGEPGRPLDERRAKTSPLRDVMGMIRSFDYAAEAVLREGASAEARRSLEAWATLWTREVTATYLRAYLDSVRGAAFVPSSQNDLQRLLTFYELEKVIYELGYEINNRPDWIEIPLRGLARLAREPASERPGGEPPCMMKVSDDHE